MLASLTSALTPATDNAADLGGLLEWSEYHRAFGGGPMRVPGPLREIYESSATRLVIMKAAQMGLSEYAINLALHTADTGRAGRGNALYIQPGGEHVGDFVQARVNPAVQASNHLLSRIRPGGSTRDPDKVGLRRVGRGYTYWRTAGSRAGLKSVDADTLILDEYDEMPAGTLDLASHRLDSSAAPLTRIISTPTYPGAGIEPEYLAGDRRLYLLPCDACGLEQALEWETNVAGLERVCADCRQSMEAVVRRAWESGAAGRWRSTNPGAPYASYRLSQLYRPTADLAAIAVALASPVVARRTEAWNQHLGLPYSPPGGQLSLEELQRLCTAPFTLDEIAGVHGCWMGVDVGARMNCIVTLDSDRYDGVLRRYLVGVAEADSFAEVDELAHRYGVQVCVVDAAPELHAAQEFQNAHRGLVYLASYQRGRMPPAVTFGEPPDPKRRWRVQVDRTGALDAVYGALRSSAILFPRDAESAPGLFAHLQAPVRRLQPDADGNPRAVYDEGARADHYAHALVYAELAAYIGGLAPPARARVLADPPVVISPF